MRITKSILCAIFLLPMTVIVAEEGFVQMGVRESADVVKQVNFTQLLANPNACSGSKIRFSAFVVRSGPDFLLFNSKEDMQSLRIDSSVLAFLSKEMDLGKFEKEMTGKLVTVEGLFRVREPNTTPPVAGDILISFARYH